jgi:protein SCO1/2
MRWVVLVAAVGVAAALFVQYRGGVGQADVPAELRAVLWPEAQPVAAFRMSTQHGEPFGAEQFRGRWNLVFSGYLGCPDVCPLTLQILADFHRRLRASAAGTTEPGFVFVSIDPAHDTAAAVASYLGHFDQDFVGLVGEPAELATLTRSLGVAYVERVDEQGVRTMDHSASIVLVDPKARVVGAFPPPHDAARMLLMFEQLIQIK